MSKIFLSESLLSNFVACPVLFPICFVLGFLARGFLSSGCFSAEDYLSKIFLSESLLSNFLACPVFLPYICSVLGFLARGFPQGGCFSAGHFVEDFFAAGRDRRGNFFGEAGLPNLPVREVRGSETFLWANLG